MTNKALTTTPSPCVHHASALTWNMLAPYGVLQALSRLSFPVLTNHFPAEDGKQIVDLSKHLLHCF